MGVTVPSIPITLDPTKHYCITANTFGWVAFFTCEDPYTGDYKCCRNGFVLIEYLDENWDCNGMQPICGGNLSSLIINIEGPFDTNAECVAACV